MKNRTSLLVQTPGRVRYSRRAGFSLIMTALCLVVMVGMMGLAIDVGRLYIAKAELQAYVDAAAMASAAKLDGTSTGVDNAQAVAISGPLGSQLPNGIKFDVAAIPTGNITTGFRVTGNGAETDGKTASSSPSAASFQYVHVTATQDVDMNFIPVVGRNNSIALSYTVSATAIAGQMAATGTALANMGIGPFTPAAHDTSDTTNWGFTVGSEYTLKWANGNATDCTGDQGFLNSNSPPQHGYIDVGQGNGSSGLAQVIEYDSCPNCPYHVGDSVDGVPGNRAVTDSYVQARSNQDPDQTSLTYAQYVSNGTGNGRRLMVVPIHDPSNVTSHGNGNTSYTIIGFAEFLLEPAANYPGPSSGSYCAIYVGPARTYNGSTVPATGGGTNIYTIGLYQ